MYLSYRHSDDRYSFTYTVSQRFLTKLLKMPCYFEIYIHIECTWNNGLYCKIRERSKGHQGITVYKTKSDDATKYTSFEEVYKMES